MLGSVGRNLERPIRQSALGYLGNDVAPLANRDQLTLFRHRRRDDGHAPLRKSLTRFQKPRFYFSQGVAASRTPERFQACESEQDLPSGGRQTDTPAR